jgi:malic enzyme
MEGKGVLFKIFADIDVFDIEINEKDPDKFVEIVKLLNQLLAVSILKILKLLNVFI